jgi:hypothetical protein
MTIANIKSQDTRFERTLGHVRREWQKMLDVVRENDLGEYEAMEMLVRAMSGPGEYFNADAGAFGPEDAFRSGITAGMAGLGTPWTMPHDGCGCWVLWGESPMAIIEDIRRAREAVLGQLLPKMARTGT